MAIEQELKDRAHDLYVFDGLTLDQVAKETGIPESTVKRWSADEGWSDERRERKNTESDIRRDYLQLRKALVAKALASLDPQAVYAVERIEALAQRGQKKEDAVQVDVDRPKIFLENLEFVASVLREINPEGLKVLAGSFDEIVTRWKAQNEKAA